MPRKKTVWGQPGQTGVTSDGIPWYVPDKPPGRVERMMYRLFPGGTESLPAGARLIPARTPAEVKERCLFAYRDQVAGLLAEGEDIDGFIGFIVDQHVPQPPRAGIEAKIGPNPLKHWWMGGGWDTMAGQLIIRFGNYRVHDPHGPDVMNRERLWVRTSRRVLIMAGSMAKPLWIDAEYRLNEVGVRPGWHQGDPAGGEPKRTDIAFADGSWLGLQGFDSNVPGSTEGWPIPGLLAELAGPPVAATVLPALGRG